LYCGKNQLEEPTKKKHYRPHGHGSISYYKRCPNKPYRATVKIKDKTISLGYFATSKEADRAITLYMSAYDESTSPRIDWTLEHFYKVWSEKAFPKLSKKTVECHQMSWLYIKKIAREKMRDLKTADYQTCIDDALRKGKSPATCQKIKTLISHLCEESMKDDVIDKNYALLLEIPTYRPREKDIFTDDKIELLKQHDGDVEAKAILILIYTGLRIGEFLKLTPNDVNTSEWYLVGGSKTKAGKNRTG
jgi:integrase